MIHYSFNKKDNHQITTVEILGHANYATKGLDIVCASVSTAIIVTLNSLEILGYKKEISYVLKENFFHLDVLTFHNKNLLLLLDNLEYTLDNLNTQYQKHFQKYLNSSIFKRKRRLN
ncbi:ribosomal-processing cysteine protease Prp ['Fragaria x ananassa' phyllody phytoplasma]|uniref:Ribosomal processing cysteine protease Prp n=1 Tax='Fragaria x ananassa' phyllody phytoplasma TaxID=2358428 RepID=A0ABS5K3H3_9MOLU|nr:ribosomal-processing cysteine protease Prp ['Fragaria x ananassa' phyllody phytoplasma]MBS2126451.1 ribosomal-processing cysteine protease Prp ['Fragaria x ananassa' phyllody phytoplasma]